jgi:prepilin peptidase CpaA
MVTTIILIAGAIATIVDVRTRRVPNALTMGLAVSGALLSAIGGNTVTFGGSLAGCALGLALMLPGHMFGATGAGDVKLLAAFGTLLGPAGILGAFIRTAIVGGVIALSVAAARGRVRETVGGTALLVMTRGATAAAITNPAANNRFPYAPAIAIGAALVAVGW